MVRYNTGLLSLVFLQICQMEQVNGEGIMFVIMSSHAVSQWTVKKRIVGKSRRLCKLKKRLSCPVRGLANFPRVCVECDWSMRRPSDIGKAMLQLQESCELGTLRAWNPTRVT